MNVQQFNLRFAPFILARGNREAATQLSLRVILVDHIDERITAQAYRDENVTFALCKAFRIQVWIQLFQRQIWLA